MSPASASRQSELAQSRESIVEQFASTNEAREEGLRRTREVIRACSRSIRAVHRNEQADASRIADEAEAALRLAQAALAPHPKIAHAGFLHDAEKEYAEARLTAALAYGLPLPGPAAIGVEVAAWLNGLAEAASEMRRYLLDQLRAGDIARGESLLDDMDDVYDLLASIDFPDALTGGLRRTTDAYRAVLERTRSDYTTSVMQVRLQTVIEASLPPQS